MYRNKYLYCILVVYEMDGYDLEEVFSTRKTERPRNIYA